jgi:prevent-host-death family protein
MAYTVHQAKTQFSKLMREAEAGREVIVMRGKKPAVKLVPVQASASRKELAGSYSKGAAHWDEDAFDPVTDEELIRYGFGYMLDAPLVPVPEKAGK